MPHRGDKIGPYLLLDKIGRGGFGEVWLAEKRTSLATIRVALKLPHIEDVNLGAIRAEADVWCSVSGHPNVLPIIDADVYGEHIVIVSEYVKGGSLADWLKNNDGKAPSIAAAVQMLRGILDGLEYLHSKQVVHRDLKPQNILLQEGIPRLADFGISKILRGEHSSTQHLSGTIAYMPPEAFENKRSFQTDVWSVGVIFYQMLSGQLPFAETDHLAMMRAIIDGKPADLSPAIPREWRQFVMRALIKDRSRRFQTAAEMKTAWDAAFAGKQLDGKIFNEDDLTLQAFTPKTENLFDAQPTMLLNQSTQFEESPATIRANTPENDQTRRFSATPDGLRAPRGSVKKRFAWVAIAAAFLMVIGGGLLAVTLTLNMRNSVGDLAVSTSMQSNTNTQTSTLAIPAAHKKYLEMNESEKSQFVSIEANKILRLIQKGDESEISAKGKALIQEAVNDYNLRRQLPIKDSCGNQTYAKSDLTTVLRRGAKIAPDITIGFKEKEISPLVGIYMAMIESEFCPCLAATDGFGGLGIYQFSTNAAISYGLKADKNSTADNPDERCNPEPAAQAAAIYLKKLLAEDFGNGENQMTLAIAAFNAGESGLRKNIKMAKEITKPGMIISFWTLVANQNKMSAQFQQENVRYVTRFFAAAIVGENPQTFGVDTQPLSSYTN